MVKNGAIQPRDKTETQAIFEQFQPKMGTDKKTIESDNDAPFFTVEN